MVTRHSIINNRNSRANSFRNRNSILLTNKSSRGNSFINKNPFNVS